MENPQRSFGAPVRGRNEDDRRQTPAVQTRGVQPCGEGRCPGGPLTVNGSFRLLPKHSIRILGGTVDIVLERPIAINGKYGKEAEMQLMERVHTRHCKALYRPVKEKRLAVTIKDVEHVAALARLSFTEEEKQKLTSQLNEILHYMDELNSLDTDNVEPLSHVIELSNVFREDVRVPSLPREEALKNAPANTDEYFKVPKVIGER